MLSDFGLSRELNSYRAIEASAVGSPYMCELRARVSCSMAPELLSNKPCTSKVDVYSFGCIIDEVMSERRAGTERALRTCATWVWRGVRTRS